MSPGCPGCNTGTPAYRALRVGSIEYVGLWHDNAARTFLPLLVGANDLQEAAQRDREAALVVHFDDNVHLCAGA